MQEFRDYTANKVSIGSDNGGVKISQNFVKSTVNKHEFSPSIYLRSGGESAQSNHSALNYSFH